MSATHSCLLVQLFNYLAINMPVAIFTAALRLLYFQRCPCHFSETTKPWRKETYTICISEIRSQPPPNHSRQPWIYSTKLFFLKPHYAKFLMCGDLKLWLWSCNKTPWTFKIPTRQLRLDFVVGGVDWLKVTGSFNMACCFETSQPVIKYWKM
jgi:hypothetical protein